MESTISPYKNPSGVCSIPDDFGQHQDLNSGRRMVNLCMFSWLAAVAFGILPTGLGPLYVIAVLIVSLVGVTRLASALVIPKLWQFLCGLAMLIPLVNVVAMWLLSERAARALIAEGYNLGMFMSKKKNAI